MAEFRLKLCFLFILSLIPITFGFIYNEGGCTILKTWERAGFVCSSVNLTEMNENLEAIFKKRFLSERQPINLLLKKIQFDSPLENHSSSIRENWLTVQVSVEYLHLDNVTASIIEKDAFNVPQFENLNELVIKSRIKNIDEMAFNGLKNLKMLTLREIEIETFEPKTLKPLETLQWFTMQNCIYSENSKVFSVNNLFGIIDLPYLTRLKIMNCNLSKTIDRLTFRGIRGINELHLISDKIEIIGPGSFDVVFTSLTYLNLAENRLRSLPDDIITMQQGMTTIKLDSNLWHCDCHLEGLRQFIQLSLNEDVKQTVCETPIEYAGQRIYDLPSLCSYTIPTPFPTEIMISDDRNHDFLPESHNSTEIHCGAINVRKYVTLKKSTKMQFPSIRIKNGNLILYTAHLSKNFFYFGYEQSVKKILKCIGNSMGDKVRKIKIAMSPNQIYRLCRIKRKHKSITPLECTTYFMDYDADSLDAWIQMKNKVTFVWISIFIGISMPFIGILISGLLAKLFPKFIRGKTVPMKPILSPIPMKQTAIERFRSIRSIDQPVRRRNAYKQCPVQNQSINSDTTKNAIHETIYDEAGYFTIGQIAPPLPPRNKSIHLAKYKCCNSDKCECYCEL